MSAVDREPYPRIGIPPADDAGAIGPVRLALVAVLAGVIAGLLGALVPMLVASGVAVLVASALRGHPVYDVLRERLPQVGHP